MIRVSSLRCYRGVCCWRSSDSSPEGDDAIHAPTSAYITRSKRCAYNQLSLCKLGDRNCRHVALPLHKGLPTLTAPGAPTGSARKARLTSQPPPMSVSLHRRRTQSQPNPSRAKGRPAVSLSAVGRLLGDEGALARSCCNAMPTHARRGYCGACGDDEVPQSLQSTTQKCAFVKRRGSGDAQLRSLAMLEASGDIVALRRAPMFPMCSGWMRISALPPAQSQTSLTKRTGQSARGLSDHAIGEDGYADVVGQSSRRVHYSFDTSQRVARRALPNGVSRAALSVVVPSVNGSDDRWHSRGAGGPGNIARARHPRC